MIYKIANECLNIEINGLGAELWSIKDPTGTEYLWQGNETYWKGRSTTIFPYTGRMFEGKYQYRGQTYEMMIHGFAKLYEFDLVAQTNDTLVLSLQSSKETLAMYPFAFELVISYTLEKNALSIGYTVRNFDEKTMYFGIGGHPGFNVPLDKNCDFTDYTLKFDKPCAPMRVGFTENHLLNDQDEPFPLQNDLELPLVHSLFDNDAIFLYNTAKHVTLQSDKGKKSVTVSFPNIKYLGFWHALSSDAPYVCIEPWESQPSHDGVVEDLEAKSDLLALPAGETYQNTWSIAITY